jgi:hypothetical protein
VSYGTDKLSLNLVLLGVNRISMGNSTACSSHSLTPPHASTIRHYSPARIVPLYSPSSSFLLTPKTYQM